MPKKYEFLEHPADIKLRAYGKDLATLFTNAALGMMEFIYKRKTIKITNWENLEVEAENIESLLVNWLSELLYLSDVSNRIYLEYEITKIKKNKIFAKVGSGKTRAKDEIKAVTYNELQVCKLKDGWVATVVFDI